MFVWQSLVTRVVAFHALAYLVATTIIFSLLMLYEVKRNQEQLDQELQSSAMLFLSQLEEGMESAAIAEFTNLMAMSEGIDQKCFQYFDQEGNLVASSDTRFWDGLDQLSAPLKLLNSPTLVWKTQRLKNGSCRLLYFPDPPHGFLMVGTQLKELEKHHRRLLALFAIAGIAVLILGVLISTFLVRRAMSSMTNVTQAAVKIQYDMSLKHQVALPTGSLETDELGEAFNAMLSRIDQNIKVLKESMDSIAHDLKTPLTRLQSALLTHVGSHPELQFILEKEFEHMKDLVDTLLELSSVEAGSRPFHFKKLDFSAMVQDLVEFYQFVCEEKGIEIVANIQSGVMLMADPKGLQRIISNLFDNAVKYTPKGNIIRIEIKESGDSAVCCVKDQGIGIQEKDLPRIFDRFFRSDESRHEPGNGLGLTFVKTMTEAMGGKVEVHSEWQKGSTFCLHFPRLQT